jgi:hypothetical protein
MNIPLTLPTRAMDTITHLNISEGMVHLLVIKIYLARKIMQWDGTWISVLQRAL